MSTSESKERKPQAHKQWRHVDCITVHDIHKDSLCSGGEKSLREKPDATPSLTAVHNSFDASEGDTV